LFDDRADPERADEDGDDERDDEALLLLADFALEDGNKRSLDLSLFAERDAAVFC
jgi:hypothetical protein